MVNKDISFVIQNDVSKKFIECLSPINSYLAPDYISVFKTDTITECMRRILYRVNSAKPDVPYDILKNLTKEEISNKWIHYIKKCKEIRHSDGKHIVTDCNFNLMGHIDCVVTMDDISYALNVFSVDPELFDARNASRKHVVQMTLDMWLASKNNGLILYENKLTNEYKVYNITFYQPIINSAVEKCKKMIEFKLKGKMCSRPYKTKDSNECSICEFKSTCWVKGD